MRRTNDARQGLLHLQNELFPAIAGERAKSSSHFSHITQSVYLREMRCLSIIVAIWSR